MEIVHGRQRPKAGWIRRTKRGPKRTGPQSFSLPFEVSATPKYADHVCVGMRSESFDAGSIGVRHLDEIRITRIWCHSSILTFPLQFLDDLVVRPYSDNKSTRSMQDFRSFIFRFIGDRESEV